MKSFLLKHWPKFVLGVGVFVVLGYVGLGLLIGSSVKDAVTKAKVEHPQLASDPVAALLAVAEDEDAGLARRNRAIWALGQLGSHRALPVLESLQSQTVQANGGTCDHANLICLKELDTAVAACQGGLNAGAVLWRHGELALSE